MPRVVVPSDLGALLAALSDALTGPAGAAPAVALAPLAHPGAVLPDGAALVVRTSGSTGTPREVVATRDALLASIGATAARLGGHGRWLLALPWHHVAGAQVVARSVVAGTVPGVLPDAPFTPALFARHATDFLDGGSGRTYVSLVPTQLHRIVEAARGDGDGGGDGGTGSDGADALAALTRFDAVLVGGAATSPALLDDARRLGVRVVTTYGMSETCGGCVYDGVPLDGVRVRLGDGGRVELGGPVVAAGYLGDEASTRDAFVREADGSRWFRTSDVGALVPAGTGVRLRVLGRADDVIVTGGEKVAPLAVEHALAALGEVCVVGVPDPEWGQTVTAVVVRAGAPGLAPAPPDLADAVRTTVRTALGGAATPKHVLTVAALPLRGPGKVDRRGLAASVAAALAQA